MTITAATICSGIGAPETAARLLGLPVRWLWASEIDKQASRVHAARCGSPNLGDMTAPDFIIRAIRAGIPDLIAAGTPCQAFSVAGGRRSLDDERGNLTLQLVRILNGIDRATRSLFRRGLRARPDGLALLWENVPGVLSTKDNAFGCFLGALAGSGASLEPPGGRWTNAGVVLGPARKIAWRVLDAQGFAPQRRRRVFLVAVGAGSGLDPERVLFETEAEALANLGDAARLAGAESGGDDGGLDALYQALLPVWAGVRGDTAAGGEARQGATHDVAPSLTSSGRGVERGGG